MIPQNSDMLKLYISIFYCDNAVLDPRNKNNSLGLQKDHVLPQARLETLPDVLFKISIFWCNKDNTKCPNWH